MARKYDHIRKKAIELRTQQNMTLDDICDHLKLPKTTVYYWIKDIPIPRTNKQTEAQRKGTESSQRKYRLLREEHYQQGLDEAPELLKDPLFRDFVVLYIGEGTKKNRNVVEFVNSNAKMVRFAHRWMKQFSRKDIKYRLQYHMDHDVDELRDYWATFMGISADEIKLMRKSNSGKMAKRKFRSEHGLLTISTSDTYFRARLQAWMDMVKQEW